VLLTTQSTSADTELTSAEETSLLFLFLSSIKKAFGFDLYRMLLLLTVLQTSSISRGGSRLQSAKARRRLLSTPRKNCPICFRILCTISFQRSVLILFADCV
jgi:hypothetical protein